MDASGGYRIVFEFYLETRGALDAKYEEPTDFGYGGHCAPYDVTPELRSAMVDPDSNHSSLGLRRRRAIAAPRLSLLAPKTVAARDKPSYVRTRLPA
jgi:hypothetical protein